jgi:hypothetical protein
MRRTYLALAALLLFIFLVRAGGEGLKGTWKVAIIQRAMVVEPWLLKLESKNGKTTGTLETAKGLTESALEGLSLEGQKLRFTVRLAGDLYEFEGVVPRDGKVIRGTLTVDGKVRAALLEPTKLESMKFKSPEEPEELSYAQARERIARKLDDPRTFDYAAVALRLARKEGARPEEVKGWTDALLKAAADYGPRWEPEVAFRLAEWLVASDSYLDLAEELRQRAVKLQGERGGAEAQLRGVNLQAALLRKAGKHDELKAVTARLDRLEEQGHAEALKGLPFSVRKVEVKGTGRAVLVELFTGAQCPPCVAADLAFDGLKKTFPASQVVLLQHHLDIPARDALTNPVTEARRQYYGEDIDGVPAIVMDGKLSKISGGVRQDAAARYEQWLKALQPLLEREPTVKLQTEAVRKGEQIAISTSVRGPEKPGKKVKLRLALVEGWVRYQGGNGLAYHSRVVRTMPGGPEGVDLPREGARHTVTVDLDKLRAELSKHLDKRGFRDTERQLLFRELRVVAFVQDDETREVLQAVDVPVGGARN